MVEKIEKSKEKIELEKLVELNPLYNVDYSEVNQAIISDKLSFIEGFKEICKDSSMLEKVDSFILVCNNYILPNDRDFYQFLIKYLIPLTLLNPNSDYYKLLQVDFWEHVKNNFFENENKNVIDKDKFRIEEIEPIVRNIILFTFSFSYLSTLLFNKVFDIQNKQLDDNFAFSNYELNVQIKMFNKILIEINDGLLLKVYKNIPVEQRKKAFNDIIKSKQVIKFLVVNSHEINDDNSINSIDTKDCIFENYLKEKLNKLDENEKKLFNSITINSQKLIAELLLECLFNYSFEEEYFIFPLKRERKVRRSSSKKYSKRKYRTREYSSESPPLRNKSIEDSESPRLRKKSIEFSDDSDNSREKYHNRKDRKESRRKSVERDRK